MDFYLLKNDKYFQKKLEALRRFSQLDDLIVVYDISQWRSQDLLEGDDNFNRFRYDNAVEAIYIHDINARFFPSNLGSLSISYAFAMNDEQFGVLLILGTTS